MRKRREIVCVPGLRTCALFAGMASLLFPHAAAAQTGIPALDNYITAFVSLERHEIAALALTLGVLLFGVVTAILLVRARARMQDAEAGSRHQIATLTAEIDRVNALLLSEPQIVVAWPAADDEPDIIGDTSVVAPPGQPQRVLAFGTWLSPERAQMMQNATEALRARGEAFSLSLVTLAGRPVEAEGRAIGGRAVLRLRDISGIEQELRSLAERYQDLNDQVDALHTLIDALPVPAWARDRTGDLMLVNAAYARAVEARDPEDAVERGLELLDRAAREQTGKARAQNVAFQARVAAIAAGDRRTFDVLDLPTRRGSAGAAIDVTEIAAMRSQVDRMSEAHRRTLDQLSTAVAIFSADQRLVFYNTAYRSLWELDPAFLDQGPADSAILDQLRAARRLPEEQDFRQWKAVLHSSYSALDARLSEWHLPNGRTLRVVTNPNPQGGVTYLFDDVTERLDLARRYDALIDVQGETLDNLSEAVAVFASDGRLRLYNPSFARLWRLAPEALAERPHIEAVIAWCMPLHPEDATMRGLRATVTSMGEREPMTAKLERRDGSVVNLATVPLPDGATLVTFQDVTDSVKVERNLRERNRALIAADEIKLAFLHHVSYELRSPLTNIIGFAHFLGEPSIGSLSDKQSEYLGYITASTNALLAIINDILDLASIDAGAMVLDLGPVDIRDAMSAAAEGIRDRLVRDGIALDIRSAADIGSFTADERRVRQVLFNLLSNAVGASALGGHIVLTATRDAEKVMFTVADPDAGAARKAPEPPSRATQADPLGSGQGGAGLGLSIVRSFVELHGGTVQVSSAGGRISDVTCTLPLQQPANRSAA